MKVKTLGIICSVISFVLAFFNFLVYIKAIELGQGKNGGNVAFYLVLLFIALGIYAPRIIQRASKFFV
jgi:hypothetical protein